MAKFKTRARTIDMLGRQQIAGIPTAISELFKNAHDAYAQRVEVDYFRSDSLFVLRDDGLGMTLEDFEKRWLTLGTESKLDAGIGIEPPPADPDQALRPILGEKGIGRLAIASIGPQLLILSRAKRNNALHEIVSAYIHWGIFECPGIDLDEIEIPVRIYGPGQLPTESDVANMLTEFKQNFKRLNRKLNNIQIQRMERDLELFNIDPLKLDELLGPPSLSGDGHGTHFIILPASDLLSTDIDGPDMDTEPPLQKALLGFCNTMTPDHNEPVITAAFRDHKTNDLCEDLITDKEFFSPDEFKNADHHIVGAFDEYGQFEGKISIYGEEYNNHIVPWPGGSGRLTLCGPFRINVAHVQGAARESTLPLEDWGRLTNKMNRLGGLYIYRDGIRILPYGDTDFDWLDIEKNRTKGASYYYFSYRRIFGVVEIGQKDNDQLKEKAGREGFIENLAYRQLKSILKNFFIQLAADFFREQQPTPYTERYVEIKANLERLELARRKREQLVSVKRKKFETDMVQFFLLYDRGQAQNEVLKLTDEISKQLETASHISDPKKAAVYFLKIETDARRGLSEMYERYRIVRPRGVGLSKSLEREWSNYIEAFGKLEETVFAPAEVLVEDVVSAEAQKARLELDRRLRIEGALDEISTATRKMARSESAETRQALTYVDKEVIEATQSSLVEIESVLKDVFAEFARLDVSSMEDAAVVEARTKLESRISKVKDKEQQFFQYIRTQLEAIDVNENLGQMDQMEALEQRVIAWKSKMI